VAVPCAGVETALTLNESPSGSVSLAISDNTVAVFQLTV